MIQRIQSIFLLLAGLGTLSLFFLPFATTSESVQTSPLLNDGIFNLQDNVAMLALFVLGGVLSIAAIFLFQNRKNQLLAGRISFIANLLGMILVAFLFLNDGKNLGSVEPQDGLGAYLPLLSLVFLVLAMRSIQKDENVVRSMDRLR